VPSEYTTDTYWQSEEKETTLTHELLLPLKEHKEAPVIELQSITDESDRAPDTTNFPLGLIAIVVIQSVCPTYVLRHSPVVVSHTFKVLSILPDITCFPFGKNATA
jgi:hypothetical protein